MSNEKKEPTLSELKAQIDAEREARLAVQKQLQESTAMLKQMQSLIDKQQDAIIRPKVKTWGDETMDAHRLAQERLQMQRTDRNVGRNCWRVSVKKMRRPIIMWSDAEDPHTAMGEFNRRYGTEFDGKKMTIERVDHADSAA